MKNYNKKIPQDMSASALKYFNQIMVTLGTKTKKEFVDAINKYNLENKTIDHQFMNSGDIIRVAEALKINYKLRII